MRSVERREVESGMTRHEKTRSAGDNMFTAVLTHALRASSEEGILVCDCWLCRVENVARDKKSGDTEAVARQIAGGKASRDPRQGSPWNVSTLGPVGKASP